MQVGGPWHPSPDRWAHHVPLAEGAAALQVNWGEVTVTHPDGEIPYPLAWITDWPIPAPNVAALVASRRAPGKLETGHNPTLKPQGDPLEHNFGHGKEPRSSRLATLSRRAFLVPTVLGFPDEHYRLVHAVWPSRQTCFQQVRALTHSLHFPSGAGRLRFILRGLELGPSAQGP